MYQDFDEQQGFYPGIAPEIGNSHYCGNIDPETLLAPCAPPPPLSSSNVFEHEHSSSWYSSNMLPFADTLPSSPIESMSYSPHSESLSQQPLSPVEGAFDCCPSSMEDMVTAPFSYFFYPPPTPMLNDDVMCPQHHVHPLSVPLPSPAGPIVDDEPQQAMIDRRDGNGCIGAPATDSLTPSGPSGSAAAPMTAAHRNGNTNSVTSTCNHSVRPYQCPLCTRAFARKHDLQRHIRVHTGAKPYPCLSCKKAFARTDALKRHLRMEEACRTSPEIQAMRCAGKRRYRNL